MKSRRLECRLHSLVEWNGVPASGLLPNPHLRNDDVGRKLSKCEHSSLLHNFHRTASHTHHPGFSSVCLDPFVLDTAYYTHKQYYGNLELDLQNLQIAGQVVLGQSQEACAGPFAMMCC